MAALERGPQHLPVLRKRGRAEELQLQPRAGRVVHAGILPARRSAEKRRKRDERSIGCFISFERGHTCTPPPSSRALARSFSCCPRWALRRGSIHPSCIRSSRLAPPPC